ncbi:MAG: MFS transporter [Clostridia bacterium]|nr:MFS transporter [Clostridia bacterium]
MNIKVLFKRNPLLLLCGQMVSMLGSILMRFALSLYILDITGSGVKFASVLAVSMLPQLFLGPFGGVIADKVSRKWLIVCLDIVSGIVTLSFAYLYFIKGELSLTAIYVLVLLLSLISTVFDPTISAIIPDIVEKKDLADINSSVQLISSSVSIVGPVLGGLLLGIWGIFIMLIIDGISYLLSAFSEMFIKPDREHHHENKGVSFFASFKEGFKYVLKTPTLLMFCFVAIIANSALNPIFSVGMPFRLRSELGVTDFIYGLSQSLTMGGAIIGSIVASKFVKKFSYDKLISSTLTLAAVMLFILAILAIPGLLPLTLAWTMLTAVIFIIIGIIIVANIAIGTAKQKIVPGNILGRVNGVIATLATAAIPLGQMVYGGILEKLDMYLVTLIFAGIVLLSGIISFAGFDRLSKKGNLIEVKNE